MKNYINMIWKGLTDKKVRFHYLTVLGIFNKMPDKKYLGKKFKVILGYEMNFDDPKTFNEKLQWLKLYDRKAEYTKMVDKYLVREYIKEKIGEKYLIPLLGVWDKPEDIDFSHLPKQFVLKCNHNSGGLCICRDKSKISENKIKRKFRKEIKRNYYLSGREWPYKNISRKIVCEKYMEDEQQKQLIDYKFYCFNGEPRFLYVSQGLENHNTARISFLKMDWSFADFSRSDYPPFDELPKKPDKYFEMIEIAKKLSMGIPFLRVDLYEIRNQIYFGELTFSPCSGMMPFVPKEADLMLGELLELNQKDEFMGGVKRYIHLQSRGNEIFWYAEDAA